MQLGNTHARARDAIDAHATEIGCCLEVLQILDSMIDETPHLGLVYPLIHRLMADQLEGIRKALTVLVKEQPNKAKKEEAPTD